MAFERNDETTDGDLGTYEANLARRIEQHVKSKRPVGLLGKLLRGRERPIRDRLHAYLVRRDDRGV
jgi:hypothetical protein